MLYVINMFNKKYFFLMVVICLMISLPKTNGLKIMEPVIEDITYMSTIDIGLTSPGEQVLVSFLQGSDGEYTDIKLLENSKDVAFLENTKKTKESIFTTINLKENIKGTQTIQLQLVGPNSQRNVSLRTTITNNVVYAYILPYDKQATTKEVKVIPIRLINKASSTKEVIITSNIDNKNMFSKNLKASKKILLQPNSVTDVIYEFTPLITNVLDIEMYVLLNTKETKNIDKDSEEVITKKIQVDVLKNIESIQNTNKHSFTLYGINVLPIHFFNSFLKYLIN